MYCLIGEKILPCSIIEKEKNFAWCKIGTAKKNTSIPYKRIFTTEVEAQKYLASKRKLQTQETQKVTKQVEECEALYVAFYKETGIKVRTIDKCWKVEEVKKQLKKLRNKINR